MIGPRHPARVFWDLVRRARPGGAADAPVAPPAGSPATPAETALALARLDAIRAECRSLVTRRASLSAGVAVVPLPLLDVGTDIAILLKLLPTINARFGLTPQQIDGLDAETKRIVMLFIGSVGTTLVGRIVTRDLVVKILMKMGVRVTTKGIVKFVPLLGQAVSASISFGAMKVLGNRHIDDCYEIACRTLLQTQKAAPPKGAEWEIVA